MNNFVRLSFLGILLFIQSCTGQKPADLKNSTTSRNHVKASCSSMVFEGQVLSKKNVLNILDCSGWAKQYPQLTAALKASDEVSLNKAFKVINDSFFSTKEKRKLLFEVIATAESKGELDTLSKMLEKALADHRIIAQLDRALKNESLDSMNRSNIMKVLSSDNNQNLTVVNALKNIATSYEINKSSINSILSDEDKEKLVGKVEILINDLAKNMNSKSWNHFSNVVHDGDSPIQTWAMGGMTGGLNVLLDIIQAPTFYTDVKFLKNSLDNGIKCKNRASAIDFNINVAQEMKHKIESLKNDSKADFRKTLLHGLTKYIPFQEFCEETEKKQGLNSIYNIVNHAFNVLPSNHDYNFLKRIHQVFGEDRFVFLSFLSSNTFSSLRDLLIDLRTTGNDAEFVKNLYEVLSDIPADDLVTVANLINELSVDSSKSKVWYSSWSQMWTGLSSTQKKDLIKFVGLFLTDDIRSSDTLSLLETVLTNFPEFSPALSANLSDDSFQESLRYMLGQFSRDGVQDDLSALLSKKGIFEFIEILTREYKGPTHRIEQVKPEQHAPVTYVEEVKTVETERVNSCFAEMTKTYNQDSSYYNLVNTLPEVCLSILGEIGFVGRIYLWMNSANTYFNQTYHVNDFHSATGVWSPGMLQFIFTAAVKADHSILSAQGDAGLFKNIDKIHKDLTDARLLETFHQFSQVYTEVDETLNLDPRLLKFINGKSDVELTELTKDGLKLLQKNDPYLNILAKPGSCLDLSKKLGVNPCLSHSELSEKIVDVLRILKRKNEKDVSLAGEIIKWIHPGAGFDLPYRKKAKDHHSASIEELIRFVYDLSNEETSKSIPYRTNYGVIEAKGTTLDRLEVVIRDIGFLNNFYGSYFMNMVAGADDYKKDIQASEKLLKALDASGGVLRTFGGLPRESKPLLKNVRSTFSALVEVDNKYLQADGSSKSYGPMIQSLLAAVTNSSKVSTQDFNPYRIPSRKVVEGHNGVFLTKVVEISGTRHFAKFIRNRFDSDLSALNSKEFKQINENLIARHEVETIQTALQTVLDKYLDNDRDQLNLIIDDAVKFISKLDASEQKEFEEIITKGLILLSDKKVSTENIQKLASIVDLSIELWPELRDVVSKIEDKNGLLKLVNKLMDSLVNNPEEVNRLTGAILESNLFKAQDLRDIVKNEKLLEKLVSFINQAISMQGFETDINWSETLRGIFTQPDTQWESLKTWFQVAMGEKEDKLTVSLLISFLGEKDADGYRLKRLMDEVFLNHRAQLDQFLQETFPALELKPD